MTSQEFEDTTGSLAREARVSLPTVKLYADKGLLEYRRAANGIRLFRRGQAPRVREIYEQRMANRGRKSA